MKVAIMVLNTLDYATVYISSFFKDIILSIYTSSMYMTFEGFPHTDDSKLGI